MHTVPGLSKVIHALLRGNLSSSVGTKGCHFKDYGHALHLHVTVAIPMCLKIRYKDYVSQIHWKILSV